MTATIQREWKDGKVGLSKKIFYLVIIILFDLLYIHRLQSKESNDLYEFTEIEERSVVQNTDEICFGLGTNDDVFFVEIEAPKSCIRKIWSIQRLENGRGI